MDTNNLLKTVVMLGKPGSGKGTQSKLLSERSHWTIFSTGEEFRKMRVEDTDLGHRVKRDYDQGLLLPHWFASYLNQSFFLPRSASDGIICEGVGRTKAESENFDNMMRWLERPYVAVHLTVNEEEVIARIQKRAQEENRPDDETGAMRVRFQEFDTLTQPSIEYFRDVGNLIEIDGMQTPEAVHAQVIEELHKVNAAFS